VRRHVGPQFTQVDVKSAQDLDSGPLAESEQAQQQVLGADERLTHLRCLIVSEEHHTPSADGEPLP